MSKMKSINIGKEIDGAVTNSLKTEWSVSNKSEVHTINSEELSAYAQMEPQQDGSYLVTGYVKTSWNGTDSVPVLDFYVEVTDAEAAIDKLIEFCETREEIEDEIWSDNATVVSLETIVETIEETDAVFAAVPEDHLASGLFQITYHVLPGGDVEGVFDALQEIDGVTIDGRPFPLRLSSVLASGTHLYRRLPLYADNTSFGPDEVGVDDNIQQVIEFVNNEEDPTPPPAETADADTIIKELTDTGVVAIGAKAEPFNEEEFTLQVWTPDASIYETVASYETIEVGPSTLGIYWDIRCWEGPNLSGSVPVYANDNIIGMKPVTADEGISNLEEYVELGCPHSLADTPWGEKR